MRDLGPIERKRNGWSRVLKGKTDKWEPKTKVCMFVGYTKGTNGGLFYSRTNNKIFVSTLQSYWKMTI